MHVRPPVRRRRLAGLAVLLSLVMSAPAVAAVDPTSRASVMAAYRDAVVAGLDVSPGWTGSTSVCRVGAESAESLAATLAAINFFRGLNRLPDATFDPALNDRARAAALMMDAAGALSHGPDTGWPCHSSVGADAAANSNLALGRSTGVQAIVSYMEDGGSNNTLVGHRRWILFPPAATFGSGTTTRANALWVLPETWPRSRPLTDIVAWPSAGYVPWALVPERWSVSSNLSPNADFSSATVTVTINGVPTATSVISTSPASFGDSAIVFTVAVPTAIRGRADAAIGVTVGNVQIGGNGPITLSYQTVAVAFEPPAPGPLTGRALSNALALSWEAPRERGTAITGFSVELVDGRQNLVRTVRVEPGARSHTFGSLPPGWYYARLAATSAAGMSDVVETGFLSVPGVAPILGGRPSIEGRGQVRVVLPVGRAARVSGVLRRWSVPRRRWLAVRAIAEQTVARGTRRIALGNLSRGRYRLALRFAVRDESPTRVVLGFRMVGRY